MSWKQPITTECLKMDTATRLIFMEIMIHARNEDMQYPEFIMHGNKSVSYKLKRGQSIFLSGEFKKIGYTRRTLERSIKLLSEKNVTINMTFSRQPFGYIVSVLNYDELTKMTFNSTIKLQSSDNQVAINVQSNNKSDKSVDNVKIEKELMFENFWNLYQKKGNRKKSFEKFQKLTQDQITKILSVVPDYVKSTPEVQYRKNAETWLHNECWNDEIITPNQNNNQSVPNNQRQQETYTLKRGDFQTQEDLDLRIEFYKIEHPNLKIIIED